MSNHWHPANFVKAEQVAEGLRALEAPTATETSATEPTKPWRLRRWEAAETTRLNEHHWAKAFVYSEQINADLQFDLKRLRARCVYEYSNNPMVAGVVNTHACDIVGPTGPQLQVQSDSEDYNEALEELWKEWFAAPEITGKMSGPDVMNLWIKYCWLKGCHLNQKVTSSRSETPVQLRLLVLDPDRLDTPPDQAGKNNIAFGIERSREGEPLRYWIHDPEPQGVTRVDTGKYNMVPAADIIHQFEQLEAGQATGVPWLAPSLSVCAELRDYDQETLDAARAAADQCVVLYTDHPESDFFPTNEEVAIRRRTMSTAPPGWKPMQVRPEYPAQNYVEYRRERHGELGRQRHMPLLAIRLDASKHNFSSARYDRQVYDRGNQQLQVWLEHGAMNPLVSEVAREGRLAKELPTPPTRRTRSGRLVTKVRYKWIWPRPPQADRAKEAAGQKIEMDLGILPFADACMERGTDEDAVLNSHQRTKQKADKRKLTITHGPIAPPKTPEGAQNNGGARHITKVNDEANAT